LADKTWWSGLPFGDVLNPGPTPKWRVVTAGATGLFTGILVLLFFGAEVLCTGVVILLLASFFIRGLLNSMEGEIE